MAVWSKSLILEDKLIINEVRLIASSPISKKISCKLRLAITRTPLYIGMHNTKGRITSALIEYIN